MDKGPARALKDDWVCQLKFGDLQGKHFLPRGSQDKERGARRLETQEGWQGAGTSPGWAAHLRSSQVTKTRLSRQGLSTPTGGWELVEDLKGERGYHT